MNQAPHIVCPHCFVTNRVAADKDAAAAKCGRCKQSLFSGEPRDVNAAQFQAYLDNNDGPLLVDFWAPWCGPCKIMAPVFKEAAKLLEPRVRLIKVNTEGEVELAGRYAIRSIPTLVFFTKGKERARRAGALDKGSLIRWVQANMPA